ncbi:MAG: serine/threonine-protein kinase, partial [Myxococcota bacterium]
MHGQLKPGDLIFMDYEVLDLAGVGATSYVYRCRELHGSKREVAVKVLHNRTTYDPVLRRRFLREARLIQCLDCENIVQIYDIIDAPGMVAFIMEHIDGPTLLEWQRETPGPRAAEELCSIFADVLQGIGHAHQRGILHCDLKPANIMLSSDPQGKTTAKIIDFGVARHVHDPPDPEDFKKIRGTAAYLSPDAIRSPYEVCEESDLYALGVILYELASGARPFTGRPASEILQAHLNEEPAPLSQHNPDISPALEEVILRTLAKRPEERFRNAEALRCALEHAVHVAYEIQTLVWERSAP